MVAVACFGSAGNVEAATATTELLAQLRPKAVLMVGIGAGLREKCPRTPCRTHCAALHLGRVTRFQSLSLSEFDS
jgi:nucleoside phosphorylase